MGESNKERVEESNKERVGESNKEGIHENYLPQKLERKKSRIVRKKTMKNKKFSFCDTFCCSGFIFNKTKRSFVKLISQVIDKKLSLEHLLKISNNLEMLKEYTLSEEEVINFNNLPPMSFVKQLKQFEINS